MVIRILDITLKDLRQLVRKRNTFLFLLIMPIIFTLLFGYAFGGFGGSEADSRLPVGFLDQDDSRLSRELTALLAESALIRLEPNENRSAAELAQLVADEELAGAIIVPARYGKDSLAGDHVPLKLIADTSAPAGTTIEAEVLAVAGRLDSALRTALVLEQVTGDHTPFDYAFEQALAAWETPPISMVETTSSALEDQAEPVSSLAHTSPGMMVQFAIAGLLTAAQLIVYERKRRVLSRLLTTATRPTQILIGHYLAIFVMIMVQFLLLMLFGWLVLKVNYWRETSATILIAASTAACIAGLGLFIGVFAKSEEQAVTFSLIPMFVLSGLGGAWVPLEVTGPTFQAIGHLSPVAWAMDGFKNVLIRGLGLEAALLPAAALMGYAVLFFLLASWRLSTRQES
jgi:ABC-2 type transport system permease protein